MDVDILLRGGLFLIVIFLIIKTVLKQIFKSKSKNPFLTAPCPPRPFVTDRQERKNVLKKAFKPELVPDNLDAIVIGSGIGGLSCAGLLSRAGKKVLVLERHDRAGGGTHTYKTKGFEFDIGFHYAGDLAKDSVIRCYIDVLTDSQLEWTELKDEFDTVVIDEPGQEARKYVYIKGVKNFKERLLNYFPDEYEAIDKFFKLLKASQSTTTALLMVKLLPKFVLKIVFSLGLHRYFLKGYDCLVKKTLKEVMDDLTDNKDLKTVLMYSFGDYGALPSQTSFLMHGLLTNHFLRSGGYYPKGGPSEIAFQVIPGIEKSGGVVLCGALVTEVIVENGKACGVRVRKTTSTAGPEQIIRAPIVISGVGIFNTYKSLIPKPLCEKYNVMKGMKCVEPGVSCMQVMVGLNGSKEDLSLDPENYWIFTSNDPGKATEEYLAQSREDATNSEIPLLFLSFPSTKDPTWNGRFPNKTTCAIVTFASLSWFEEWKDDNVKKRGQVYDSLKNTFVQQAWSQVLRRFPHLKDKVAFIGGGTPLSHAYYLNSMHGEIYGMHHGKDRFDLVQAVELRPETPIPGLFLTGQDIFTCGFSGAAFSGLITASKILERYLIFDLIKHTKELRKNK